MARRLRPYRLGRAALILRRNGYSEEEVDLLLGAGRGWREKRLEYARTFAWAQRYRTPEAIANRVIEWALENGRWPESRDFGNWNGLPCPGSVRWKTGGLTANPTWRSVNGRWEQQQHNSLWTYVAQNPQRLTMPLLLSIPNLTERRNAVTRIGGPRALVERGGATKIAHDDYGTLWWVPAFEPGEWRAVYVEVVNSTQKIDEETGVFVFDEAGKPVFDHYFLRVPPTITSAKHAVAWTGHFDEQLPGRWNMRAFRGFAAQS